MRELLHQFDGAVKPVMTLLTTLGMASVDDAELVQAIQQAGVSDAPLLWRGLMAGMSRFQFSLRGLLGLAPLPLRGKETS